MLQPTNIPSILSEISTTPKIPDLLAEILAELSEEELIRLSVRLFRAKKTAAEVLVTQMLLVKGIKTVLHPKL